MDKKKLLEKEKEYAGYALAVYLANECYQRDKQTGKAAGRRYNGTIKQGTLAAVLADKAAIVQQRLSPVSYLVIIARIFKAAFLHKKADGPAPIFWGFFVMK